MPLSNPCPSNPLITYGTGNAPTLDYNLPQKNSVKLSAYYPFPIASDLFTLPVSPRIDEAFWESILLMSEADIKGILISDLNSTNSKFFDNFALMNNSVNPVIFYETPFLLDIPVSLSGSVSIDAQTYQTTNGFYSKPIYTKGNLSGMTSNVIAYKKVMGFNSDLLGVNSDIYLTEIAFPGYVVSEFDINIIVKKFKEGKKGRFSLGNNGQIELEFFDTTSPDYQHQFYIIYDTEISSFLGNYGAGKTINTFSLLPGEKTTLTFKSFKESKSKMSKSENVLESNSSAAKNNLKNAIESQNSSKNDKGLSVTNSNHWEAEASASVSFLFFSIGGGGTSGGSSALNVSNLTSDLASTVNNAVNETVNESNSNREVKIVNTSETEDIDRTEISSIREIYNPNISRTLNYVFRQLNQEYLTIHWLRNIRFGYNNGNPDSRRVCNASNLETMLTEFMNVGDAENIAKMMIGHSCYVFNHEETPIQFFESRTYTKPGITDCVNTTYGSETICMTTRVRSVEVDGPNGEQTWDGLRDTYRGITVPGVILSGQRFVLKTDSVIVDSLLGQGEALDCYNQNLQSASVESALLNNKKIEKALEILDLTGDPNELAELYQKLFINIERKDLGNISVDLNSNP